MKIRKQICAALPVVIIYAYKTRHGVIMNWHDLHTYDLAIELAESVGIKFDKFSEIAENSQIEAEKVVEDMKSQVSEDAENEFWKMFDECEFLDELEVTHFDKKLEGLDDLPNIVKEYPNLVENVKEILTKHGENAANARRRDGKAHPIGISMGTCRPLPIEKNTQQLFRQTPPPP